MVKRLYGKEERKLLRKMGEKLEREREEKIEVRIQKIKRATSFPIPKGKFRSGKIKVKSGLQF